MDNSKILMANFNKSNIVSKHRSLVREASYRLDLNSIKLINILISMIRRDDVSFQKYIISAGELSDIIGSKIDTPKLKIIQLSLINFSFEDPTNKKNIINFMDAVEYTNDNDLLLQIGHSAKPFLLDLGADRKFLKYSIQNILNLKSFYVIRLFELCKDRLMSHKRGRLGKNLTFEISIEELRELLLIPVTHNFSTHIKKNILDYSKKEFKLKTDILMKYETRKRGNKITRIVFSIESNKNVMYPSDDIALFRQNVLLVANKNLSFKHEEIMTLIEDEYFLIYRKNGNHLVSSNGEFPMDSSESWTAWETLAERSKELIFECDDDYL